MTAVGAAAPIANNSEVLPPNPVSFDTQSPSIPAIAQTAIDAPNAAAQ